MDKANTVRLVPYCEQCGCRMNNEYPQKCTECGFLKWDNPTPVVLAVVPTRRPDKSTGVLMVRRGCGQGTGLLGLPGGFLEADESWMEGTCREVLEETTYKLDVLKGKLLHVSSPPNNRTLLIFAIFPEIYSKDINKDYTCREVSEVVDLNAHDIIREDIAFETHYMVIHKLLPKEVWMQRSPDPEPTTSGWLCGKCGNRHGGSYFTAKGTCC